MTSTKVVTYKISGTKYVATCSTRRGNFVHMEVRIMREDNPEKYLTVFATAFPVQNKDEMIMAHNTVQKILHDPSTIGSWLDCYDP